MNYRHAYHAGNFADLLKHAVLTALLAEMRLDARPLTVIDTHAGAGVYDLAGEAASKTGEGADAQVLMDDAQAPPAFAGLKANVKALNRGGGRLYPGSPELIASALRPGDQLLACEMRPDDFRLLERTLASRPGALALREDGWEAAARRTPRPPARVLVLIDPPYEAGDDAERAARSVRRVLAQNGAAVIAVWAPIKDLAAFDALLTGLEEAAGRRPILLAEVRLRPLDDPLRLNGCAVVVINPPAGLEGPAGEAAAWIAAALGEAGGLGRARLLEN
jgi:23S rRNA (adenine2030-N6)-methyltransferase